MAVKNDSYTRGGVEKATEVGAHPDGRTRCNIQMVEGEAPFMQKVKEAPKRIIIDFDEDLNGEVVKIETRWGKATIKPDGTIDKQKVDISEMVTRPTDRVGFTLLYEGILFSLINGKVEDMDGFMGKKVYNPITKELLTYSEEEENEAPTGNTWEHPEEQPLNPEP